MTDTEQASLTDEEQAEWKKLANTPHEDLSDAEVASKIKLSMKRKYSAPEWVLLFEFTGPNQRRADAIAVNTFPSRNYKILGFEFKASRSDWLAEKRDGGKADYFVQCVDEWYVVAGRRGIIEEKELPDGWGLLELKDNRDDQLWTLVESDLTEYQQGGPDRAFWGRFVQKAIGDVSNFDTADLKEARRRGYQEAREELKQRKITSDREFERMQEKAEIYDRLEAAGFDFIRKYPRISDEKIERINLAYSLIQHLQGDGRPSFVSQLGYLRNQVDRSFEQIDEALDEFEAETDDLRNIVDGEDGGGPL